MKRIRYYFASKKLQMAQLHDLQRQLQEAWNEQERLDNAFDWVSMQATECEEQMDYLQEQLHRVARERDQERKKRIDAEMLTMEFIREKRLEAEDRLLDRYLENADNEEE